MKRSVFIAALLLIVAVSHAAASGVETASAKIVSELKKGYSKKTAQDIVLADFVTVNASGSAFGDYLAGALADAFKSDASVRLLDQEKAAAVLKEHNVRFNGNTVGYTTLNEVSQALFTVTNTTPTAFCYGQIKEEGDDIRITVKMVDAETGDAIAASSVKFASDETTDKLLGKPVRVRKPVKPDTVVVVKERIVEKTVEKPVEKAPEQKNAQPVGVYTAQTIEVYHATPLDGKPALGFKTDGFEASLKKCTFSAGELVFEFLVTNGNEVTKDFWFERCRFVDEDGNAMKSERLALGEKTGYSVVRTDLVSNTPVKGRIIFTGVSPKLSTVKTLQISAMGREYVLRDIPIEKE